MTLIFETEQHGRLWLGGEKAAHNSKLLADNDVYAVWPAYKGARPESPSVFVFDVVDGTGACNGDIPLKVLSIVTDIVAWDKCFGGVPQRRSQERNAGLFGSDSAYSLVGV